MIVARWVYSRADFTYPLESVAMGPDLSTGLITDMVEKRGRKPNSRPATPPPPGGAEPPGGSGVPPPPAGKLTTVGLHPDMAEMLEDVVSETGETRAEVIRRLMYKALVAEYRRAMRLKNDRLVRLAGEGD